MELQLWFQELSRIIPWPRVFWRVLRKRAKLWQKSLPCGKYRWIYQIRYMYTCSSRHDENECNTDNELSASVYSKKSKYYALQVMCEMHSCACSDLLFSCWSKQSMKVFKVQFDEKLWLALCDEPMTVYASEKMKRPTKFKKTLLYFVRWWINFKWIM